MLRKDTHFVLHYCMKGLVISLYQSLASVRHFSCLLQVVGELALDVGCGNGQLTKVLAPLFTKIIGVDCSEEQIKKAREVTDAENIEYR